MDRGVGDAEGCLRNHAAFDRILDGGDDVVGIVQTVEDTGDVDTLGVLDLVHKLAHVNRAGIHAEGVQAAVEHVGLDAGLVEGFRKGADGLVRILAIEELDLFERTTVRFHTVEATHVDDYRSYFLELVDAGGVFAGRLPHVSINERKFYFTSHLLGYVSLVCVFPQNIWQI